MERLDASDMLPERLTLATTVTPEDAALLSMPCEALQGLASEAGSK